MTIPDAAVEAGADALETESQLASFSYRHAARAVLEAVTVETDCPATFYWNPDAQTGAHKRDCACGGTGKLRVLLPALPDNTEGP